MKPNFVASKNNEAPPPHGRSIYSSLLHLLAGRQVGERNPSYRRPSLWPTVSGSLPASPERSQGGRSRFSAKEDKQPVYFYIILRIVSELLISALLFLGGVLLLRSSIPGWNLLFGLPATQIGLVFLILTFDQILRDTPEPKRLALVQCSVCSNPTVVPIGQKTEICVDCQEKLLRRKSKTKLLLSSESIPTS
jgi:hypothetical protein